MMDDDDDDDDEMYFCNRFKREASPSSDIDADIEDVRSNEPSRALMDDIEKWKKALQHQPAAVDRRPSVERSRIIAAKIPAVDRQPVAFTRTALPATSCKLTTARQALENKVKLLQECSLSFFYLD